MLTDNTAKVYERIDSAIDNSIELDKYKLISEFYYWYNLYKDTYFLYSEKEKDVEALKSMAARFIELAPKLEFKLDLIKLDYVLYLCQEMIDTPTDQINLDVEFEIIKCLHYLIMSNQAVHISYKPQSIVEKSNAKILALIKHINEHSDKYSGFLKHSLNK